MTHLAMTHLDTIDWSSVIPAGLAIAIFAGGLLMLVSGVWASRDQ